jgi:hypothetical protein
MRVLQVYGQEGEPRKWIHLFEGATSIIFYASLSDYNKWVVSLKVQVCLLPLLQCVLPTGRRPGWKSPFPFSKQSSTRTVSCGCRSYYF